MRRYLVGKMYSKDDFERMDKEVYWDIDYEKLTAILLKKIESETYLEEIRESRNVNDISFQQLERVPFEVDNMLDIWSEVYFKLLFISNEKELLFLKERRIIISSENGEENVTNGDKNRYMKNTINNRKNPRASIEGQIFDMKDIKSTKKDAEIDTFGAEIVRLWLYKKDFRKLFIITDVRFEKYNSKSILKTVCQEVKRETSCFILEKCVGLQLEYYLEALIVKEFPKIEYEQLEKIANILCEYEAIGTRIYILHLMSQALSACDSDKEKARRISTYCEWLRVLVPRFQILYTYTVDAILDEYKRYYSLDTIMDMVKRKRDEARYKKKTRIQPMPDFLNIEEVKKRIKDIEKKIKNKDKLSSIMKDITKILNEEIYRVESFKQCRFVYGLPDFIFELPSGGDYIDCFAYREKLQALIVQKSYEKYRNRAG